jgi:hypothetical protein
MNVNAQKLLGNCRKCALYFHTLSSSTIEDRQCNNITRMTRKYKQVHKRYEITQKFSNRPRKIFKDD